jgi:hypothetical protein
MSRILIKHYTNNLDFLINFRNFKLVAKSHNQKKIKKHLISKLNKNNNYQPIMSCFLRKLTKYLIKK